MKSEPMSMKNASKLQIDHNPYMLMNYSGEYGKQYNHYVKMGMNESGVEESVKKIVEYEVRIGNKFKLDKFKSRLYRLNAGEESRGRVRST